MKMNRDNIIRELHDYFQIAELVCPHTHSKWGERAWQFLDTDYLHCLLIIRRDILKVGMVCNTKTSTLRGLRCNMCEVVKGKDENYLSSHTLKSRKDHSIVQNTATARLAYAIEMSTLFMICCQIIA